MLFYPDERTSLFIDGFHFHNTCRAMNLEVDFEKLYKFFSLKFRLVHAHFYTTINLQEEDSNLRPLINWLSHNGYMVSTKPRRESIDPSGAKRQNKMDVEIAVDIMRAAMGDIEHVVLFSGDSSFIHLAQTVQEMGKRFSVVSSTRLKPPPVSDEMRRQANNFLELADFADEIRRSSK